VQNWSTHKTLVVFGWLFIGAGIAPLAYLLWFGAAHNFRPLSMPLPLKKGEYISSAFSTDLNDAYQVDLQWRGSVGEQMRLNMRWKIVDRNGAAIQQGAFNNRLLGNSINLGNYKPGNRSGQKIVLTLLRDAQGMEDAGAQLFVETPEESLSLSYAVLPVVGWAVIVAGSGAAILLAMLFRRPAPSASGKSSRILQTL